MRKSVLGARGANSQGRNGVDSEPRLLLPGELPNETVSMCRITPAWAEWALGKFNRGNRNKIPTAVARYARDMRSGNWEATSDGLAFSWEPIQINNGQNRLYAVIESGVTINAWIFTNQDPRHRMFVDDGVPRSAADSLTLVGMKVNRNEVSVLNVLLTGPRNAGSMKFSKSELKKGLEEHRDAVFFAYSAFDKDIRKVSIAPVKGVVARAFYHADKERLSIFCRILLEEKGFPRGIVREECDETIYTLRSSLQKRKNSPGTVERVEVYQRTQRMLFAWLHGEVLLKCHGTVDDLFPLPEPGK